MDARVDALLARLAADGEQACGVAVSGGGDSMALLLATTRAAPARGLRVVAYTVDHGLRPGSAAEAAQVGRQARAMGADHQVLRWDGEKPTANLQAAARAARYALLRAARRNDGVGPLLLGHTRDDLAETFLLRLARGSGVDGLAALNDDIDETADDPAAVLAAPDAPRLRLLRPLLGVSRSALRAYLTAADVAWTEDPTNDDPRFDRVRARSALAELAPLGLGVDRLAATAEAMARARDALEAQTVALAATAASVDHAIGWARLDPRALRDAPEEVSLRLVAAMLRWTAAADYPPRLASLEPLVDAMIAGALERRTLHGCLIEPFDGAVALSREPAAVAPSVALTSGRPIVWDGRFAAMSPGLARWTGACFGAFGDRRAETPLAAAPRAALESAPAVFAADGAILACPLLNVDGGGGALGPRPRLQIGRRAAGVAVDR